MMQRADSLEKTLMLGKIEGKGKRGWQRMKSLDRITDSMVKNLPVMKETQEMWVQSLGQEDPLDLEMASPLQYSCLENLMDRGAWQASP